MSVRSAESRSHSPEGDEPAGEKRVSKKRKVLSCYACRNRKMKCDRVYPICGRCQKTGRADSCTYDPRLLEDAHVNADGHVDLSGSNTNQFAHAHGAGTPPGGAPGSVPFDLLAWKFRVQERRLNGLEKWLARFDAQREGRAAPPPSQLVNFDNNEEPEFTETMMFRGKSFKTQFQGSTSPLSLLNQFGELQAFTQQTMRGDTAVFRIRNDFRAFRDQRKALMKEEKAQTHGTDAEILSLIPARHIMDVQVALYFQMFEKTYRILHEPSFKKEYHSFWEKPAEAPASFAVTLVYVIAATKCLSADEEVLFIGDCSANRDQASKLIDACDTWLSKQSRKHRTLASFQLHCLSILAKRVNCVKLKQDWTDTGNVLRMAMAAGLHRNPSLVAGGRITEFEKEMRRRLWATIMELELQCSIDAGLPSSLCNLYFDTQRPTNLPDEAFSPETETLPAARPIEHFTNASYIHFAMQSLPLRVHVMQLLNNPMSYIQYDDVLHYDTQLSTLLSNIPRWEGEEPNAMLPKALLNAQLRQFQLLLHRPYANVAASKPRYMFSFSICVDAANTIISAHEGLVNSGCFTANHMRNDVFRAGITLSQITYNNATSSPDDKTTPKPAEPPNILAERLHPEDREPLDGKKQWPHADTPLKVPILPTSNLMAATLCNTAYDLTKTALSLFENKVMRLGTGFMEYWLLCAAFGIMPSSETQTVQSPGRMTQPLNASGEDIKSRGRRSIDRVTRLCFRVLAMQKDPGGPFATTLRSSITSADPRSLPVLSNTPGPSVGTVSSTSGTAGDTSDLNIPGASGMAFTLGSGDGLGKFGGGVGAMPGVGFGGPGPWEGLQDVQMDMSGWTFPDFWSFDMGGEF